LNQRSDRPTESARGPRVINTPTAKQSAKEKTQPKSNRATNHAPSQFKSPYRAPLRGEQRSMLQGFNGLNLKKARPKESES
jgi:hypothetical protein